MEAWSKRVELAEFGGTQDHVSVGINGQGMGYIHTVDDDGGYAATAAITTSNMAGDLAHALEELRDKLAAAGK